MYGMPAVSCLYMMYNVVRSVPLKQFDGSVGLDRSRLVNNALS